MYEGYTVLFSTPNKCVLSCSGDEWLLHLRTNLLIVKSNNLRRMESVRSVQDTITSVFVSVEKASSE